MESREIARRLEILRAEMPEGVELVAVSKFKPATEIMAAYEAGQRLFGESRVQELTEKIPLLPADIQWHFIGHLQTNKVRQLVGKVKLIESVDSEKLLKLIDSESRRAGVTSEVLLQVHVADEETKFGFSPEELYDFMAREGYRELTNTMITGMMAMATNTDDIVKVREDFSRAASIFRKIREELPRNPLTLEPLVAWRTLSMGMSGDWPIAVEEGANLIRVGSAIFGDR